MKKPTWVEIDGGITTADGTNLDDDKFLDEFIEFLEGKGWQFSGMTATRAHDYDPEEEQE